MTTTIDTPPPGSTVWLAHPERHHPVYGGARGRAVDVADGPDGPEVLVEWPALAADVGPSRQWSPAAVLAWTPPLSRTVHVDADGVLRFDNGAPLPTHADVMAVLGWRGLLDDDGGHDPADHAAVRDMLTLAALEREGPADA